MRRILEGKDASQHGGFEVGTNCSILLERYDTYQKFCFCLNNIGQVILLFLHSKFLVKVVMALGRRHHAQIRLRGSAAGMEIATWQPALQ